MKRILCSLIIAAALPFGAAFAQTAPQPIVAPVMQKDLADMPGREMLMLSVEYPPGAGEHIHRHDAYAFVYVLEGTIVEKEFIDQSGRPKIKSNVNVELAIDAMEIAPRIDQMVLFSGDGDLRSLVQAVQRQGIRVVVVSSTPTAAQVLRRQADEFIDINELRDKIGRDPAARLSTGGSRATPYATTSTQ